MPFNRILTNEDRKLHETLISDMWKVCPDTMSRKIPEANVQQAYILGHVLSRELGGRNRILSIGCFEDTAYEYLKAVGKDITGIDPAINMDLHTFALYSIPETVKYDIVFATSVIEHVKEDEQFLEDMCQLLKSGGIGIITTDFKDDYKAGDPLPYSDVRFYTKYDLEVRLNNILVRNSCELIDDPDWSGKDNFVYQGHQYSFATFVFRKQ